MLLRYDLQFFAAEGQGGEKTEPATEKKLSDARKEGQVAKSREIANGLGLLALFIILRVWVGNMGRQLMDLFYVFYGRIGGAKDFWQGFMPENEGFLIFRYMLLHCILIIAPILGIGLIIAFVSDVAQVGWKPTSKPLMPKFSKLNPLSGIKRIFSLNSLVELVKSILKIGLVFYVCYNYLRGKWNILFILYDIPLTQALKLLAGIVTALGIRIAAIYMVLAFADYIYQKVKFAIDMRMTKQEIKDEYKQSEGDPQIKAQIKARMRQASQRRMMQDVPKADVIITNPTHYAVAVQYDAEVASAPVVLAKGSDYVAQKIKEIAKENHVEIVENKPLARMLYANVEIGEAIPPELYQAVAEVLAFVYHLQGKV